MADDKKSKVTFNPPSSSWTYTITNNGSTGTIHIFDSSSYVNPIQGTLIWSNNPAQSGSKKYK